MTISRTNPIFIPIATLVLALLSAMSPFAIDTYLSAMPTMSEFYGVEINKMELTISIYFLFFAIGQFIGGPLSDFFGRKPIATIGLILYGVASFSMAETKTFELLLVYRALQAFGGGWASVVNMAIVRDWFDGKKLARLSSIIGMIMMLAPMFAPIMGTFLLQAYGWQAIFYTLAIIALFILISFTSLLPESRIKGNEENKLSFSSLFGRYIPILKSKEAVLIMMSLAFANAGMFTFVTGASFVYIQYFGLEISLFPILFGANVLLNILLTFANVIFLKKYSIQSLVHFGLILQLLSGVSLGFSCMPDAPNFWCVFLSIVVYIGSLGMVFGNSVALVMSRFGKVGGAANALIGVTRFVLSSLVGVVLSLFHTGDLKPIGLIMLFCTAVANVLFVLYKKHHLKALDID